MSKQLREEFAKVKAEALELVSKAQTENRALTGEEKEANGKRFSRLDTIRQQLDEENKFASMNLSAVPAEVMEVAKGSHSPKAEFAVNGKGKLTPEAHKAAVSQFIRTGSVPHELFTIVAGAGGITLPAAPPVVLKRNPNPFKQALAAFNVPIVTAPPYQNVPILNDLSNSALVIAQDLSSGTTPQDPTVTNLVPGNLLYSSRAEWLSNTLLNSLDYDIFNYFIPMLRARIESAQVAGWTSTITSGGGAASVGVTTASPTDITIPELVAAEFSVPASMQSDLVFILSRGLMQLIKSKLDTTGRPIYMQSLSDNAPNELLGHPVFVSDSLADPGANAISGIVASASSLVVRVAGPERITKYVNNDQHPDQSGIEIFQNGGFGFANAGVKLIKFHA